MVFVFSIFLFDCNENRIEEFIVFLKKLFNDVILYNNGIIVEFVFFFGGKYYWLIEIIDIVGDMLINERV